LRWHSALFANKVEAVKVQLAAGALDNVTIETHSEGTAKELIGTTPGANARVIKDDLFDISVRYNDRLGDQSHVSRVIGIFILPGAVATYDNAFDNGDPLLGCWRNRAGGHLGSHDPPFQ
jgi:hypothetical protein